MLAEINRLGLERIQYLAELLAGHAFADKRIEWFVWNRDIQKHSHNNLLWVLLTSLRAV